MRAKDVLSVSIVVLIAVGSYARQTSFLRNEHLLVAGNEPSNGSGKVWYTSRFAENVTVIDMGGLRVSSACGIRHPARCRNLVVNSTHHGDYVSSHAVFVPLDNGFYVIEITHNGSTTRSMYTSHETFHVMGPSNCVSVGIFKIGTQHYSLCATPSNSVCTCQLNRIENSAVYVLRRCRSHFFITTSILHQLSNVVALHIPRQPPLLLFFIGNVLYHINLSYGTSSLRLRVPESVCPTIEQITLEDHKLYMYCTNVSAVYDLNDERLLPRRQLQLFYPCSSTTNVTIDLGVAERAVSNLTYRSVGTDYNIITRISALPGTSLLRFGTCITLQNNSIFLYLDWNDGVYLFNGTTNDFYQINNTQCYIRDQCQWPQVFNNQYLAVRGSSQDSVAVYDIGNFQTPILNLNQVSYQIGVVIDNFKISQQAEITRTPSTSYASTLHPSQTISSTVMPIHSPISNAVTTDINSIPEAIDLYLPGTVTVAMLSFIVIMSLLVAILFVLLHHICRNRRNDTTHPVLDLHQPVLTATSSTQSTARRNEYIDSIPIAHNGTNIEDDSAGTLNNDYQDHEIVIPQEEANPRTGPDNSSQPTHGQLYNNYSLQDHASSTYIKF